MRLRPYLPSRRAVLAATGLGWTTVRRRASRDRWALGALAVVIAVSAFLATAVPRLLTDTFDAGLQDTVHDAGSAADIVLDVPLPGPFGEPGADLVSQEQITGLAAEAADALPDPLRPVTGPLTAAVTSPSLVVSRVSAPGRPARRSATGELVVQLGYLHQEPDRPAVDYLAGSTPGAGRGGERNQIVPVAVSEPVAKALQLPLGTRLAASRRPGEAPISLVVAGVFRAADPQAAAWSSLPTALRPRRAAGSGDAPDKQWITLLVGPGGLPTMAAALGADQPTAHLRLPARPSGYAAAELDGVRAAVAELSRNPEQTLPGQQVSIAVETELPALLDRFHTRARAALAELSLVLVGVVGVAAVVLLLSAQLLVGRRRELLALEHARGGSITSIAVRLLAESALVTALAAGLGAVLAVVATGGLEGAGESISRWVPLIAVAAVALLAAPAIGGWSAWQAWGRGTRRAPANRRARSRLRGQRQARRAVIEGVVLLAAAGSVVALRGRGLLQTRTDGVDLFLAAAPLLLAAAATVLLLRLYPYPVRGLAAMARRRRGPVGLVAASRASRAVAALPLLALTLAVGLAVAAGLIRGTMVSGLEAASWQRVGADLRATGTFTPADVTAVRDRPGVRAATAGMVVREVRLRVNGAYDSVTLVAVDGAELGRVLSASSPGYRGELAELAGGGSASDAPLRAVPTADLAARLGDASTTLLMGGLIRPVEQVGVASAPPSGYLDGPLLFVDLAAFQRALAGSEVTSPALGTLWAIGDGASAAADEVPALAEANVLTRGDWLAQQRTAGLLERLLLMLWWAVIAVGGLAAVAVVATVLGGARERGGTLAALRTLGLTSRQARWLTLGELVPLVLAGLAGGVLAGWAIVDQLAGALGLVELTGGVSAPPVRFHPPFAGAVAGGLLVLLVLAVVVEAAAHRRDRLADVLRVGGSR